MPLRATLQGHTGRVVSLAMSPMSDAFLSAAEDRTCRLWDLRTPVCSGVMRACDAPVVAWDHQGLVFAVVTDDGVLKMFDAKQYEQGPFITFTLVAPPAPKATARTPSSSGARARHAYACVVNADDACACRARASAWMASCCWCAPGARRSLWPRLRGS